MHSYFIVDAECAWAYKRAQLFAIAVRICYSLHSVCLLDCCVHDIGQYNFGLTVVVLMVNFLLKSDIIMPNLRNILISHCQR